VNKTKQTLLKRRLWRRPRGLHRVALPSRHNHYHPPLLRASGLIGVIVVILLLQISYNYRSSGNFQTLGYATNISPSALHGLTNQERNQADLPAYVYNSKLASAAQAKAKDMFSQGYWAHNAPDGTTPWSFITSAGYSYKAAGENLAKDFNASTSVVSAWMGSTSHRANIISAQFKDVGYGVVNGTFDGEPTTIVVAMYAAPHSAKTTTSPSASSPTPSSSTDDASRAKTPTQPKSTSKKTTQPNQSVPSQPEVDNLSSPQTTASTAVDNSTLGLAHSKYINALLRPASLYQNLNWSQRISIYILSVVLLLVVLQHTLIWRTQRRGLRHIWLRAHPLFQVTAIIVTLLATLLTGVGTIL
jgi:hypothetical protein